MLCHVMTRTVSEGDNGEIRNRKGKEKGNGKGKKNKERGTKRNEEGKVQRKQRERNGRGCLLYNMYNRGRIYQVYPTLDILC